MTTRSLGQRWVLDIALAQDGFNALHPHAKGTLEMLGHDHTDFDKVFAMVETGVALPKAWATIAAQARTRAGHLEDTGARRTASDLYARAAVMFGRAQYSIFDGTDPIKAMLRAACDQCVSHLAKLRDNRVRRVELDFEGHQIFALLHLPKGPVAGAPAVILGPGMDMIKEDYIAIAERFYTNRGVIALSIEGPGQGESRARGLTVDLDNYPRAIARYVEYLGSLPEVDPHRIGMVGISMSGYWGLRTAAVAPATLRAVASIEGVTGDFETIFEEAQPSFKDNYMYMAGYHDEPAFDELARQMPLGELVEQISCPVLLAQGEYDECTPLPRALETYERIRAPKEMRVYESEFHPLGGVAAEFCAFGADWILRALDGEFDTPGRDERFFMHQDGSVTADSADPTWWNGHAPARLHHVRHTARSH